MTFALYAGSFDPITNGHLSVLNRVAGLFEKVVVLVAVNENKRALFSPEERVELITASVSFREHVTVKSSSGLVVECARELGARYLIRGIRDQTDMAFEHQLAFVNQQLAPEITTLFVPAELPLSGVSSSRLKQLAAAGADVSDHCSALVADALRRKVSQPKAAAQEKSHGL